MNRYYAIPLTLTYVEGQIVTKAFPMGQESAMALDVDAPANINGEKPFSQLQFQIRLVGFEHVRSLRWDLKLDKEKLQAANLSLAQIDTDGSLIPLPDFEQSDSQDVSRVEAFYLNFALSANGSAPVNEQITLGAESGIAFSVGALAKTATADASLMSTQPEVSVQNDERHPPRIIIRY